MSSERHNLIAFIRQVGAKEATRALKEYEGSIKKTTGSLGAFDIALGVTAGSLATRGITAIVGAAREGLVLSARLDTVSAGFDAFTATVEKNVISLKTLRSATKGTVADVDLLTTANNALALGLPVERMNELFESARIVGNVMGRTTLQAVQDLSTGIGRQSRLILDNLGIIVNTEQAYREFATTLGKTVSQLTETERKAAFAEAAMAALSEKAELLSGSVSETQTNLERWNSTVKNTTVSLGSFAGAVLNVGFALTDTVTDFISLDDVSEDLQDQVMSLEQEFGMLGLEFNAMTADSRELTQNFTTEFAGATVAVELFGEEVSTVMEDMGNGFVRLKSGATVALDALERQWLAQAEAVGEVWDEVERGRSRVETSLSLLDQLFQKATGFVVEPIEPIIEDVGIDPTPIEKSLEKLEDTLKDSQSETDLLRLEQLKLTDAFKDGRISEEDYEKASDSLEDKLRALRILQSELRIAINLTTDAMKTQTEALDIGPLGEPMLPGETETFNVPFLTTPELGSMFAGLAGLGISTSADRTTNIEITVDVDKLSADPTEIEALVQQMAEALFKELQKRGGVP